LARVAFATYIKIVAPLEEMPRASHSKRPRRWDGCPPQAGRWVSTRDLCVAAGGSEGAGEVNPQTLPKSRLHDESRELARPRRWPDRIHHEAAADRGLTSSWNACQNVPVPANLHLA